MQMMMDSDLESHKKFLRALGGDTFAPYCRLEHPVSRRRKLRKLTILTQKVEAEGLHLHESRKLWQLAVLGSFSSTSIQLWHAWTCKISMATHKYKFFCETLRISDVYFH
ncbi:hypothetical protein O6H91_11G002400 [Diphasiastrum complanatum]|uniref:Uncharacterized protein n=1 Tax=Diphasiastrum complanatum TaxID=34168 RepID=A0ACC2C5R1_DIPCM|nr:hypothetical protein O6H91_11G002400 [Diphasiastrum complanatum]